MLRPLKSEKKGQPPLHALLLKFREQFGNDIGLQSDGIYTDTQHGLAVLTKIIQSSPPRLSTNVDNNIFDRHFGNGFFALWAFSGIAHGLSSRENGKLNRGFRQWSFAAKAVEAGSSCPGMYGYSD
jgi:hypothetical protein